jgi:3-oxoacyl-[acyl-carrier protein] reductase
MRLPDRVALVTGAGSGIGQAIAELFAREGAAVAVVDRRPEGARQTVDRILGTGGQALAVVADVAAADQVAAGLAQATAAYGRVDVLVNNAAVSAGMGVLDTDEEAWDYNLEGVLKTAYLCCRAVLPGMLARRSGCIVNIASVNGLTGLGGAGYSAAKAGMINLTQTLAVTCGPHGVRVNAVCPGTVRTPIWRGFLEVDPGILDRVARYYPLGRVGEPMDVAWAALFLASDEASWITGQALVVDGGLLAGNLQFSQDLAQSLERTRV